MFPFAAQNPSESVGFLGDSRPFWRVPGLETPLAVGIVLAMADPHPRTANPEPELLLGP